MTLYWMLNSQWPSFFGHMIDYYLKPGGAYYGAKQGLKPVNIVFDYYATGDKSAARIHVTNQTIEPLTNVSASVSIINLDGTLKYTGKKDYINVGPNSSVLALDLPRIKDVSSTFFVRCQLKSSDGRMLAENLYWQSTADDELDPSTPDDAFKLTQRSWADFSALNQMPKAEVETAGDVQQADGWATATVQITNPSKVPAFFLRAEIVSGADGDEILPITWDDNYLTLIAGESRTVKARYKIDNSTAKTPFLRLQGHNVAAKIEALKVH